MEQDLLKLLQKVNTGDEEAYSELSDLYSNLITASVEKFAKSFESSSVDNYVGRDDLRQYALLALFKAAKTYVPNEEKKGKDVTFGLYAKICINNSLTSLLRKHNTAVRRYYKIQKVVSSKSDDPLDVFIQDEGSRELKEKILNVLSNFESEVFRLYVDGKSAGEISDLMNVSSKSVSNALFRIRVKIKGLLTIK